MQNTNQYFPGFQLTSFVSVFFGHCSATTCRDEKKTSFFGHAQIQRAIDTEKNKLEKIAACLGAHFDFCRILRNAIVEFRPLPRVPAILWWKRVVDRFFEEVSLLRNQKENGPFKPPSGWKILGFWSMSVIFLLSCLTGCLLLNNFFLSFFWTSRSHKICKPKKAQGEGDLRKVVVISDQLHLKLKQLKLGKINNANCNLFRFQTLRIQTPPENS